MSVSRFSWCVIFAFVSHGSTSAQSSSPKQDVRSIVDSISAARAAYTRANAALQKDDLQGARLEFAHAAAAWPSQPRYPWASAFVSALAHDTTAVLRYLEQYADLGLGRNLRVDSTYAPYWNLPAFTSVERLHDAHRASRTNGLVAFTLPDSTFWPEGMDIDQRNGNVYVASVRYGTIAEISNGDRYRELMPRGMDRMGSMLGVRVDPRHNVLYATVAGLPNASNHTAEDTVIAALLRIRIDDGRIEKRWDLPTIPGGHVLGDVLVDSAGNVYTTDSLEPSLYELRSGSDSLVRITSPLFMNLQGMAASVDGRILYVADYISGILRVDLANHAVSRVSDAPNATSIGCDGIVFDHGALIAVQNGVNPPRVVRFTLGASGNSFTAAEVLDQNPRVADEPTIGAMYRGDFYYVANGQWDDHNDDGTVRKDARLTKPTILKVPISR